MTPEERTRGYLREVKRQADLISGLLAEPQFGLATWCLAYGNAMSRITELWKGGAAAMDNPLRVAAEKGEGEVVG